MRLAQPLTDADRIAILKGLLQLRRDGHFYAIWATDNQIRVQYEFQGPTHILSWRRAMEMVETARQAFAVALPPTVRVERKDPASERSKVADRAKKKAGW